MILDLVLRWLHVVSAAILAGGLVFWWLVADPALRAAGTEAGEAAGPIWRRRWGILAGIASGLILVSGLINAARIMMDYQIATLYHMLVGVKLLVALAVFYLAAKLGGRSESARRLQKDAPRWLAITALLAILLIMLGGFLRSVDRVPREDSTAPRPEASTAALPAAASGEGGKG